jgi:hypothetical protein
MKHHKAVAILIAGALIAAVAAPVAAYAIPGLGKLGGPAASSDATKQARFQQRQELLKQRVAAVLTRRSSVFSGIADKIAKRIARVSAIADKVEVKGGDVSSVRMSLATAGSLLEQAKTEQAKAATMFAGVPDAANKKAAFAAARAQAKVAVQTLKQARVTLRNAVLNLRAIVNGLKAAGE